MGGASEPEDEPRFALPISLAAQGFVLRREGDADRPFLLGLYASTRAAELAPLPWPPEQKAAFVEMQFAAQWRHYRATIPHGAWLIIEHQGRPVGRLYLEHGAARLQVVDIALVDAWRDRGVGTTLLRALKASADRQGRVLGLFVEKSNPALRLYQRLGFRVMADTGVYLEMAWSGAAIAAVAVAKADGRATAAPS